MEHTPGKLIYQDHRQMGTNYEDWHAGLTIRDKRNIAIGHIGTIDAAVKDEAKANAARIVQTWNAHDGLVEACKEVLDIITSYQHIPAQFKACKILQAALAKAGKEA